MTNCKVLSFQEIHRTNQFFTDCEECVNLNYRKNLELEYENEKNQQAKVDLMYWKNRATEEQSQELVNVYENFQKELSKRQALNGMRETPGMKPGDESLKTPFNYEINIPSNTSTPRGPAISLSDLSGPVRVSNGSTARANAVLDTDSAISNVLRGADSLIRRMENNAQPSNTARQGLSISPDILANSRAGLRPANTRPASAAPPSNTSQRAQQSGALMDELRASLASRASRGSRRSSVAQLSSPSSSAISNASSVLANVAEVQLRRRGRPVNVDLTDSEVRGIVGNAVNDAVSGSGLRKKKTISRKNCLM